MIREFNRIFGICAFSVLLTLVFAHTTAAQSEEPDQGVRACSQKTMVGSWMYATDLLEFRDPYTLELIQKGTSLGVMTIDAEGNLTGSYDTTLYRAGKDPVIRHIPNWVGTVTVNPDCTGTLSFGSRVDNLVISSDGSEFWGMVQTAGPGALISYRAKRTGPGRSLPELGSSSPDE